MPAKKPSRQATPERVRETDGRTVQVWHLLTEGQTCDGNCDWHDIACGDGIVMPGGTREVPLDLDEPGQRWCPACLTQVEAGLGTLFRRLGPPASDTEE